MSEELTFFVWGDTHFGYQQRPPESDIRFAAVRQMAALEGTVYPEQTGGTVGKASLILHCGDIADGTETEYRLYEHCMRQIDIPHYDTLGNHDLGQPAETHVLERHGQRWFSVDVGGVHFVSLFRARGAANATQNDDIPPVSDEQLTWLADDLSTLGPHTPVVAFCHAKPENCPNASDLDAALSKGEVKLIFYGHLHRQACFKPFRHDWNGRDCVQLGHCRNHPIDPDYARTFVVARFRPGRYDLAQWRWDLRTWAED